MRRRRLKLSSRRSQRFQVAKRAELDWQRVVERGTGFFGYRDPPPQPPPESPASGPTLPQAWEARHTSWEQAATGPVRDIINRAGGDTDLLRAAILHLAEVSLLGHRAASRAFPSFREVVAWSTRSSKLSEQKPRPAMKDEEVEDKPIRAALAVRGRLARSDALRDFAAVHWVGGTPKNPSRSRGSPGETEALRVFSALAEHLRQQVSKSRRPGAGVNRKRARRARQGRRRRTQPWRLLLPLRDAIFPPLFSGRSIPFKSVREHETSWRAEADRLRNAVKTYRRDRRLGRLRLKGSYVGGADDLWELRAELRRMRTKVRNAPPRPR
jgi:hypothetical protein